MTTQGENAPSRTAGLSAAAVLLFGTLSTLYMVSQFLAHVGGRDRARPRRRTPSVRSPDRPALECILLRFRAGATAARGGLRPFRAEAMPARLRRDRRSRDLCFCRRAFSRRLDARPRAARTRSRELPDGAACDLCALVCARPVLNAGRPADRHRDHRNAAFDRTRWRSSSRYSGGAHRLSWSAHSRSASRSSC